MLTFMRMDSLSVLLRPSMYTTSMMAIRMSKYRVFPVGNRLVIFPEHAYVCHFVFLRVFGRAKKINVLAGVLLCFGTLYGVYNGRVSCTGHSFSRYNKMVILVAKRHRGRSSIKSQWSLIESFDPSFMLSKWIA
jgi:hypothetical protein